MKRWPLVSAMLLVALSVSSAVRLEAPVRGITISTHRGGGDWASDRMPEALANVRELGANWVAVHPYGRIDGDGSVRVRRRGVSSDAPPEHVARPIREARALGLRILVKPHLAYWGSPFTWRGEIRFTSDDHWNRFFRDYERYLLELARWSKDADAFVVGTELRGTVSHESEWRELIAKVRRETSAPLTYAANWDDYEDVPFWDALDAIGIQAYFPLTDESDRSEAAIRRGWRTWLAKLAAFSKEKGKPILFTELGYNQSYDAPVRPWDDRTDDEGARELQELCLRTGLEAIEEESTVVGVFLWKWFVPPREAGRNFQLATPGMRRVIRERWAR